MRLATAATITTAIIIMWAGGSEVVSAPKASEVPLTWQLDFEHGTPQAMRVKLPGRRRGEVFWYLRYTVTNNTGQEILFVPEFLLYTDTGQVVPAGQKVPTAVFKDIKKLVNEPLLRDMTGITGRLLQGADHAKDGVAIWKDFDPKSGAFDIFIGGLSGETAEIDPPVPVKVKELDSKGNELVVEKDKIVLTRTLNLQYKIVGEAAGRARKVPELLKKEWVMR